MAGKDKSAAIFCGVFSVLIFAGPGGLLAQTRLGSLASRAAGEYAIEILTDGERTLSISG
jgi:hypothetical protein